MAGPSFYRQGGQSKPTHGIGSAAVSDNTKDRHDIGSAALSSCPNCGHSLGGK